jgi:hypothetical protein
MSSDFRRCVETKIPIGAARSRPSGMVPSRVATLSSALTRLSRQVLYDFRVGGAERIVLEF